MDKIAEQANREISINLTRADTYEESARVIAIKEVKRLAHKILECGKFVEFAIAMGGWHFERVGEFEKYAPNRFVDSKNVAVLELEHEIPVFTEDEVRQIIELHNLIEMYDERLKLTGEGVFLRPNGVETDGMMG